MTIRSESEEMCSAIRFASIGVAGTVALLLVLLARPAFAEVLYVGFDEPVQRQLQLWLGEPEAGDPNAERLWLEQFEERSGRALRALGYYRPDLSVERVEAGRIRVSGSAGEPVSVESAQLQISGEAATDDLMTELAAEFSSWPGRQLDHGEYESFKRRVADLAAGRGYFDAELVDRRLEVRPESGVANLFLHLQSGARYRYGNIEFRGSPVDEFLLRAGTGVTTGEPYHAADIAELTRALHDTGYFNEVRVDATPRQDGSATVPVVVELQATEPNRVDLGVGFATNTGPRATVSWTRPYVNSMGHQLRVRMGYSSVLQQYSADYRIPDSDTPATRYYKIEGGGQREEFEGQAGELVSLAGLRVDRYFRSLQQTLQLRFESERFEIADQSSRTNLLLAGGAWSLGTELRLLGLIENSSYYALQVVGGSRSLGSDIDLVSAELTAKMQFPVTARDSLLLRGQVGGLWSNDFDRVPLSHRFYAGGDQSIRGFDYKSLSPKDASGKLVGGKYLATGTVELVHRFTERWGAALFADAGDAYDDSLDELHVGVGGGLRWYTPVGLLSADLAFGVSESDLPVRLHLRVGPEL